MQGRRAHPLGVLLEIQQLQPLQTVKGSQGPLLRYLSPQPLHTLTSDTAQEFHLNPQPKRLQPKDHSVDQIKNDKEQHWRGHCPQHAPAGAANWSGHLFHKSSTRPQNPIVIMALLYANQWSLWTGVGSGDKTNLLSQGW